MDYIRNHWQGNQSLVLSFWVNLVALRVLILFFQQFTHPPFTGQTASAIAITVLYVIFFHLIVFPWQAVGLLRACDRYISERGSYITAWVAQITVVVCLLFTLVFAFTAFQSLFAEPHKTLIKMRMSSTAPNAYKLTLTQRNTRIHLQGDFEIGITKELAKILEQTPRVSEIVLSSDGGQIAEGRGIARLIKRNRLDTYVFDNCKSACTTAFIGGVTRILGPNGRLGFHQYGLNVANKPSYFKPEVEQQIDQEFFRQQGIDEAFIDEVYQASHTDIWFPGQAKLLAAGVVHRILDDR